MKLHPIDIETSQETVFRVAKDYRKMEPINPETGARYRGFSNQQNGHLDEARKNADFVWARKQGPQSRYSDGTHSVMYTANHKTTCYVEVGYHLQNLLLPVMNELKSREIPHIIYKIIVKGKKRDYMHLNYYYHLLCKSGPEGYEYCNNLARVALKDGIDYIKVPSARSIGKPCNAVFRKTSTSSPKAAGSIQIVITADRKSVGVRLGVTGPVRSYLVDRVY